MKYTHLYKENLPWIINEGKRLIGVREIVGAKHNPVILQWAKDVGLGRIYTNDEIPWCGLFVAKVCQLAKKDIVKDPLWARNWAKWGRKIDKPGLGDILVFARGNGGHVGFYIAEDATCYHVLGGNQNNTVNVTRILKNRLLAAREANYTNRPLTAVPYIVAGNGKISTNEA